MSPGRWFLDRERPGHGYRDRRVTDGLVARLVSHRALDDQRSGRRALRKRDALDDAEGFAVHELRFAQLFDLALFWLRELDGGGRERRVFVELQRDRDVILL